jgi:hypothetical protein
MRGVARLGGVMPSGRIFFYFCRRVNFYGCRWSEVRDWAWYWVFAESVYRRGSLERMGWVGGRFVSSSVLTLLTLDGMVWLWMVY